MIWIPLLISVMFSAGFFCGALWAARIGAVRDLSETIDDETVETGSVVSARGIA